MLCYEKYIPWISRKRFCQLVNQSEVWMTEWMKLWTHKSTPSRQHFPDSKVHGANMEPTWVLSVPGGPHVCPINLAVRVNDIWYHWYGMAWRDMLMQWYKWYHRYIYIVISNKINYIKRNYINHTKWWHNQTKRGIWRIMYVLEWRTVSALTRGIFWCLFPELRSNEANKYQNNTRVSAETVRHELESTYVVRTYFRHICSLAVNFMQLWFFISNRFLI